MSTVVAASRPRSRGVGAAIGAVAAVVGLAPGLFVGSVGWVAVGADDLSPMIPWTVLPVLLGDRLTMFALLSVAGALAGLAGLRRRGPRAWQWPALSIIAVHLAAVAQTAAAWARAGAASGDLIVFLLCFAAETTYACVVLRALAGRGRLGLPIGLALAATPLLAWLFMGLDVVGAPDTVVLVSLPMGLPMLVAAAMSVRGLRGPHALRDQARILGAALAGMAATVGIPRLASDLAPRSVFVVGPPTFGSSPSWLALGTVGLMLLFVAAALGLAASGVRLALGHGRTPSAAR